MHWNVFGGRVYRRKLVKRITLEREAIEGNSPVFKNPFVLLVIYLKYHEERKPCGNQAGLTGQD